MGYKSNGMVHQTKESKLTLTNLIKNMTKVRALINDPRIPGGSPEEIEEVYGLEVDMNEDGTFSVEGDQANVDSYLNEYGIFVDEDDYEELDD
jgi:hypothetical protein